MKPIRNPDSAPGDWYIDSACIDCGASRHVAPDLIIGRNGKSVFARQPETPEEQLAAWRAVLVCPTASVRSETKQPTPRNMPSTLARGFGFIAKIGTRPRMRAISSKASPRVRSCRASLRFRCPAIHAAASRTYWTIGYSSLVTRLPGACGRKISLHFAMRAGTPGAHSARLLQSSPIIDSSGYCRATVGPCIASHKR
jgi:ferredoxin